MAKGAVAKVRTDNNYINVFWVDLQTEGNATQTRPSGCIPQSTAKSFVQGSIVVTVFRFATLKLIIGTTIP
jgi:hypothetical protein